MILAPVDILPRRSTLQLGAATRLAAPSFNISGKHKLSKDLTMWSPLLTHLAKVKRNMIVRQDKKVDNQVAQGRVIGCVVEEIGG